ncbi:hypothetical protein DF039_34335 [Burkholderia cenocepacia]|nr:hypothetical protein DF039_34335 [Burkholderia cenocepacia]
MTDEEFIRDMQANIVQIAKALTEHTNTPRERVAQYFKSLAELPSITHSHQAVAQALKQAAEEIEPKSDSIETRKHRGQFPSTSQTPGML